MKILIVTYYSINSVINGATLFCHNLAQILSSRGHQVTVYSDKNRSSISVDLTDIKYEQVSKPFKTSKVGRPETVFDDADQIRYFKEIYFKIKPDIVHFNHLECLSPKMIQIAYECGCPTIFTAHDYYLICPQTNLLTNNLKLCAGPEDGSKCGRCYPCAIHDRELYPGVMGYNAPIRFILSRVFGLYSLNYKRRNIIIRKYINKLTSLVSPSNYLLLKFNKHGISSRNDKVIPNGVKVPSYVGNERNSSREINFIFIGGSKKNKGANLLMDAFLKIKRGAKLYIYGHLAPVQKIKLTKKSKICNCKVVFKKPFRINEIDHAFINKDVLVLPSIWEENYPLVAAEALIRNIPCIVPDLGGAKEIGDLEKNIFQFEFRNADSLCSVMKRIIDQKEFIFKNINQTYKSTDRWSSDNMVDKYEELYSQLKRN